MGRYDPTPYAVDLTTCPRLVSPEVPGPQSLALRAGIGAHPGRRGRRPCRAAGRARIPGRGCSVTAYLAIDLRSASFEAAVFDDLLRPLGRGSAPSSYDNPSEARIELTVDVVREAVREAARCALESAGARPAAVDTIAVTSQAQTFLVSDDCAGPKTPFISWQDDHGREAATQLLVVLGTVQVGHGGGRGNMSGDFTAPASSDGPMGRRTDAGLDPHGEGKRRR